MIDPPLGVFMPLFSIPIVVWTWLPWTYPASALAGIVVVLAPWTWRRHS
jgi:hypothetical protein